MCCPQRVSNSMLPAHERSSCRETWLNERKRQRKLWRLSVRSESLSQNGLMSCTCKIAVFREATQKDQEDMAMCEDV